jgi:hypothetical protein
LIARAVHAFCRLARGSWRVNAPATPAFPTSMSVSKMPDPEFLN